MNSSSLRRFAEELPVASIIFGAEGIAALQHLGTTLREKTRERAGELDGALYDFYSPWLCIRPVLNQAMRNDTLCSLDYASGAVITDNFYLQSISSFLREHSSLTRDLLIGTYDDWQLLEDVAERPEVVPMLDQAQTLIIESSDFFARVYPLLVEMIIPLKQPRPRGWTCQYARGAIFLGFAPQYSIFNLALDLVHEMGHQALALFQSADRLIASDWNTPVYSEVRRTNRPAIQSLHATAAIAFMTSFAEEGGLPRYVHPEFDDSLPEALARATSYLREACEFTPTGAAIMDDFEELAARCLATTTRRLVADMAYRV